MLRLYGQSLFSNTKESLTDLSKEVCNLYRARSRSEREIIPQSFGHSIHLTQFEFMLFVDALLKKNDGPLTIWRVLSFSIGLPLTATVLDSGSPMQPRAIFDFMLSIYPWKRFLLSALRGFGLSTDQEYIATAIAGALLQVLSIQISHGQPLKIVGITSKTALISLLYHWNAMLIERFLRKILPFVPTIGWTWILGQIFDSGIQRFVRFGLVSTCTWLAEKVVKQVMKIWMPPLPDLPTTVQIPPSLECPICHDLLRNPVVVLGHFFCEDCLGHWLESHVTHPYTAEPMSAEMVEQSVLMSQVVYKWHRLALEELPEGQLDE
jgi:hypothetical protein